MNRTLNIQKSLIIFVIPLLIIMAMVLLVQSTIFATSPNKLSIGITLDLLFIMPLIHFLLIRKTEIPKTTIVPILILGVVVSSFIIPEENQYYLSLFKTWVLPIVELSILAFVGYNVLKAIKLYKAEKENNTDDFFTILKVTCSKILPKTLVNPVVTEISVFYYGFFYWKKRKLNEREFSYHKDSGTIALLFIFILIIGVETITVHFLLAKWSNIAAWILTGLSIYSSIQIFGFLKSIIKRPISIDKTTLYLKYGIMNETTIKIKDIESVILSTKEIELNKTTRKLSFLGEIESHNVVITLKNTNTLHGLYGIKRSYTTLALYVDNKNDFKNKLDQIIQSTNL